MDILCKNDNLQRCLMAICKDCWSSGHNGHSVVPLEPGTTELVSDTRIHWGNICQCQHKYRDVNDESLKVLEKIKAATDAMNVLASTESTLRNSQNPYDVKMFRQNTLTELEKQTDHIIGVEQSISSLAIKFKEVANFLETAKKPFEDYLTYGDNQSSEGAAQKQRAWKLKNLHKGTAAQMSLNINTQYCSRNQLFFSPMGQNGVGVFKEENDTIKQQKTLSCPGKIKFFLS